MTDQRRVRRVSRIASLGPVNGAPEDAAVNHMMAERRRRVKQKENFTALRKLVPIISKVSFTLLSVINELFSPCPLLELWR